MEDDNQTPSMLSIVSPSPSPSLPLPSSSPDFDSLWSSYESQLAAARDASAIGLTITPAIGFAFKMVQELPVIKKGAPVQKRKLFVNVCHDEHIDAPAAEDRPEEKGQQQQQEGEKQLRIPLSIGPMRELPDVDKASGEPISVLCIDVVLNPSTVAQCEAADFRAFVAQFIAEKIANKYDIKFVAGQEPKFPKLKYKGVTPPPSHLIRRPPRARLVDDAQAQEIKQIQKQIKQDKQNEFIKEIKSNKTKQITEVPPSASSSSPSPSAAAPAPAPAPTPAPVAAPTAVVVAPADSVPPTWAMVYSDSSNSLFSPSEWPHGLSTLPVRCVVSVDLPAVGAISELDVEISGHDILLQSTSPADHGHRYFLHVPLPFIVADSSSSARFVKKSRTLTLTMPIVKHKQENIDKIAQAEKAAAAAAAAAESSQVSSNSSSLPVRDWAGELRLQNKLIYRIGAI